MSNYDFLRCTERPDTTAESLRRATYSTAWLRTSLQQGHKRGATVDLPEGLAGFRVSSLTGQDTVRHLIGVFFVRATNTVLYEGHTFDRDSVRSGCDPTSCAAAVLPLEVKTGPPRLDEPLTSATMANGYDLQRDTERAVRWLNGQDGVRDPREDALAHTLLRVFVEDRAQPFQSELLGRAADVVLASPPPPLEIPLLLH